MGKIYSGAIDCSFNYCGCAVLCKDGKKINIETTRIIENPPLKFSTERKSVQDLDRCSILYSKVKAFIDDFMTLKGSKVLSFEVPGGSQSSRAAACLGMAKGVLGSVIFSIDRTWLCNPIMPSEVHKRVTGEVKASKEQVISYILKEYNLRIIRSEKLYVVFSQGPLPEKYNKGQFEHIADAIVMAEIGLERV